MKSSIMEICLICGNLYKFSAFKYPFCSSCRDVLVDKYEFEGIDMPYYWALFNLRKNWQILNGMKLTKEQRDLWISTLKGINHA